MGPPLGTEEFEPWSPHDPERTRRSLSDLLRVRYDGKRLAERRQFMGTLLIVTGAPAIALSWSTDPTIRRTVTVLALAWLALLLPVVRLLYKEWRNHRLEDGLLVRVHLDNDRR